MNLTQLKDKKLPLWVCYFSIKIERKKNAKKEKKF